MTAAGEVRHPAYQIRLGLWGEGASFPLGFAQFTEEIEAGGMGAMEMIGSISLLTDNISFVHL